MEGFMSAASVRLRRMFYLLTPEETLYTEAEDVPSYIEEAIPVFVVMGILEFFILVLQGRPHPRFNAAFSSIAAGLVFLLHETFELLGYCWMYERYHIVALPSELLSTWMLGFICVELFYYLSHRCMHEVNIFWMFHHIHHSFEDFNVPSALRLSFGHKYALWLFYLPLTLFIPPPIFFVHSRLNQLYQFWLHTEISQKSWASVIQMIPSIRAIAAVSGVVRSLGPLEWILNTPSHHRVHHGRNPYCIDKNFGGFLIIFDRIFGTFQEEEEEVVYGVVPPLKTWDFFHIQFCQFKHIIKRLKEEKGWKNKLSVIFKGPGWSAGTPRTGSPKNIPEIERPVRKYDRDVPLWTTIYIWLHLGVLIVVYCVLSKCKESLSPYLVLGCIVYILVSLANFSAIYDHKFCFPMLPTMSAVGYALKCLFIVSFGLWFYISVRQNSPVQKVKSL